MTRAYLIEPLVSFRSLPDSNAHAPAVAGVCARWVAAGRCRHPLSSIFGLSLAAKHRRLHNVSVRVGIGRIDVTSFLPPRKIHKLRRRDSSSSAGRPGVAAAAPRLGFQDAPTLG